MPVKETKGVVRAFSTSGRWDVIAEVEAGDVKALTEVALRMRLYGRYDIITFVRM